MTTHNKVFSAVSDKLDFNPAKPNQYGGLPRNIGRGCAEGLTMKSYQSHA